jgi:hypothetical protein
MEAETLVCLNRRRIIKKEPRGGGGGGGGGGWGHIDENQPLLFFLSKTNPFSNNIKTGM